MLEIVHVQPDGTAARLGLQAGDRILSINNEDVNDVIDFHFLAADEHLDFKVLRKAGGQATIGVDKDPDDRMGLEFPPLDIKRCRNKCVFCFVDQMPAGCRRTLYIKDDDFRASFLHGNFITLGALSEADWDRIFRQRLSPLYISVHATEPGIRSTLLNNGKAPDIMSSLKRLAAGGIRMHAQIVLCPGINDGEHLERTIRDLAGLFPAVLSIAVVPVGLTAFRKGLAPLKQFSRPAARQVLESIERLARKFKKQLGARLVFASDEFYIKAGEDLPKPSWYEDFPQIENGVGMVAAFLQEVSAARLPAGIRPVQATVVTGVSFSKILGGVLDRLRMIKGLSLRQITVTNRFFGPSVTVAGLLTGSDLVRGLKGKRLGDVLVLPSTMVKEDDAVFLDGMTIEELEQRLKVKVSIAAGFSDLLQLLRSGGGQTS